MRASGPLFPLFVRARSEIRNPNQNPTGFPSDYDRPSHRLIITPPETVRGSGSIRH